MTIEQRLEQVEQQNQRIQRTNKRLTVALTMMAMSAITIQFSACGDDPAGPSTKCDVSDVGALAGRNLSECDLRGANLWNADLEGAALYDANLEGAKLEGANLKDANLVDVRNLPELSAKQEEDACWSDCG